MEVTLAALAGLAFGVLVEYAQARLGWWVGVIGGALAAVAAVYAFKGLDTGWIVVFVFGGAYLFTEVVRSWFTREERQRGQRGLVSH